MESINREIFVFYQKGNELFQVCLNDEETNIIENIILDLHDDRIKVLEGKFCDIKPR